MHSFRNVRPSAQSNRSNVVCLHPRKVADEELDWFFTKAEGQMGLRSNYMDMLLPARHRESHDLALERRIAAATAYRVIEDRLGRLGESGESLSGVLKVAYEVRPWPRMLQDDLGHLAGVVVRLALADTRLPDDRIAFDALERRTADRLCANLMRGRDGAACALDRLRAEARARYERALHAYLRERGSGPSVVRWSP